ncbi:MAG: cupin domain-containing protein [Caldilineaceae bacterium]
MPSGKFMQGASATVDTLDWGTMKWFSRPEDTAASHLVVIEVELQPGFGHDFHKHPGQEEVIYVLEGSIEQWLEQQSQTLNAGDAVFIAGGVVHASFNVSAKPARLHVTLGPSVGAEGYQLVDVAGEEPWKSLRG